MNNFSGFMFPSYWGVLFWILIAWSLVWKGLALWKSARLGKNVWFVVLLLVNTFGILEILYLYVFSKKHPPVE
ncbi:MAG: hypothetical protein A3C71_01820 [Candidatus Yanofskybacteria bacterium RIFCSPHIGHO2_02_FULL_43_15c]|uniref:DUF5652 domain-containing protein n=2 Tax=Candidatus Yanofskyibacteriota TaxID=1752733 RepID=A0A1F8H4X7_9BACT|nr:MAG: hypothetical protein A3C71_01820 [Candidatus Yanofskybacteria bacterium RIFCSPHIGHO2_02_FULL_43_15c]OGN32655.1 MAG: hypothetical protein A3I92_02115 [Candidatus Yanofskybacteria bacterium RIFCSPLOWO2_02_FULL_43_10b]